MGMLGYTCALIIRHPTFNIPMCTYVGMYEVDMAIMVGRIYIG